MKIPEVDLEGRESLTFAELDDGIDELSMMKILLSVETEFESDIPEKILWSRIGEENRRDYLNHITILMLAEILEELQRSPSA